MLCNVKLERNSRKVREMELETPPCSCSTYPCLSCPCSPCLGVSAPVPHQLRCISSGASALVHQLWCINSGAAPGGGVIFPVKFFFFIFLMENGSIMPKTDFKQKYIFLLFFLLTVICPSQGGASRVKKNLKSSTFKAVLMALEVT